MYKVPDEAAGKRTRCKECDAEVEVPHLADDDVGWPKDFDAEKIDEELRFEEPPKETEPETTTPVPVISPHRQADGDYRALSAAGWCFFCGYVVLGIMATATAQLGTQLLTFAVMVSGAIPLFFSCACLTVLVSIEESVRRRRL